MGPVDSLVREWVFYLGQLSYSEYADLFRSQYFDRFINGFIRWRRTQSFSFFKNMNDPLPPQVLSR